MSSVMRFDTWQDSNGNPVASGVGGFSAPGSILQVVSTNYTGTFASSSATPANVTGFAATITPSSTSSKILVLVNTFIGFEDSTSQDPYPYILLTRNGTSVGTGVSATGSQINTFASASGVPGASDGRTQYKLLGVSRSYLDSPSTTSSLTYQIQFAQPYLGDTSYINRQGDASNASFIQRPSSDITLMEVAV